MMCSLMLTPHEQHGRFYQFFERMFDWARDTYGASLRWTMRHRGLMLLGSAFFLVLTVWLYQAVPQGFIPRQDTGVFFGNTRAPEGLPFNELEKRQAKVAAIIEKNPNVEAVMSTAGQGTGGVVGSNIGRIIVRLKSREERKAGADEVIQELRRSFAGGAQGLRVFMNNPPSIRIGGLISTSDYQLVLQGSDQKVLYEASGILEARLRDSRMLQDVNSSLELRNPEIQIDILRDRAAGVSVRCTGLRISTMYCSSLIRNSKKISMPCDLFLCSRLRAKWCPFRRLRTSKWGLGPYRSATMGNYCL
jgi:HAE1 family hydrophobic/amphiphilic exporter-1